MSLKLNPRIFREYDVRGLVDKDLSPEFAEELGKGYGTYLRGLDLTPVNGGKFVVTVGYDARPSSPIYCDAISKGIASTGVDVIQLKPGPVPTPQVYFSWFHLKVDGGIMITGSHLESIYNGFKMGVGKSTIFGDEIQKVLHIMQKGEYATGAGEITQHDLTADYERTIKESVGQFPRQIKVVADAGNGAAGELGPKMLRELGAEVIELYCEIDGTFPNHHPDPTVPETMVDLIKTVKKEGADLGIGYDGDADRIGVVDENGEIIWGDQLMILFARETLEKIPGAPIIFEVKCSQALPEEIEKAGGEPIMWKAGHSLIKQKMKETGSPMAGEMSGHIFFGEPEWFGFDDAIYAGCRTVRLLARSGKSVSEMLANVPKYYSSPEIRLDCPDDEKFKVVKEVTEYFRERYDVVDVDGVRVLFGDGWGLVRASNTSPVLVLRFEARTPERLAEIKRIVGDKVKEVSPSIELPW